MHPNIEELVMRTVGLMETLPDRIKILEENIKILELDYTKYKAISDSGCDSHKHLLDKELEKIKEDVESIRFIIKTIQEEEIRINLINRVTELEKELQERKDDEKRKRDELLGYKKEFITRIIGWITLPVVIFIFLLVGIPSHYMPWYIPPKEVKSYNEFENALSLIILSRNEDGSIYESELSKIQRNYPSLFFTHINTNVQESFFLIRSGELSVYKNGNLYGRPMPVKKDEQ